MVDQEKNKKPSSRNPQYSVVSNMGQKQESKHYMTMPVIWFETGHEFIKIRIRWNSYPNRPWVLLLPHTVDHILIPVTNYFTYFLERIVSKIQNFQMSSSTLPIVIEIDRSC